MENLESYFAKYRRNIVGIDSTFESPFGLQKLIYADWIASGRMYKPIEEKMCELFGPLVGNTHSEASETGTSMTHAYHLAQKIIKKHVNAGADDVIITAGTGMTDVVNKLQRMIGLKVPFFLSAPKGNFSQGERAVFDKVLPPNRRPVVFVTHLEHHSNHTSWIETIADVVVLEPNSDLLVNSDELRRQLEVYKERPLKIGAFSACSNVTGVKPQYYELAKIMHQHGGYAFIDFAASAPYVSIDMHPADEEERLDAVMFSPHKFLGGPGSSGVLVFNKELYNCSVPDTPGGGTVNWTDRWNHYSYIDDIEAREDGGTPGFLQAIRAALVVCLKEEMGCENIRLREEQLLKIAFDRLRDIKGLHILAENVRDRIGVVSFYIENVHHNLVVRLLNDRYGIQVRGGCSCAGTYGHYLLNVDEETSKSITSQIDSGDLSLKPGWVRLSLHPTMTNAELHFIIDALKEIAENVKEWSEKYFHSKKTNEYFHRDFPRKSERDFYHFFMMDHD